MNSQERALHEFAEFAVRLKGDEKSEAQTFLFHLLEAFSHNANTLPENSTFEYRVRFPDDRTKFADFVWPGRVLIEMKSRGAKLSQHYQQTFDYWLNLVPHRPPYVVLCNFDEFWVYDFNTQLNEPVDRVKLAELPARLGGSMNAWQFFGNAANMHLTAYGNGGTVAPQVGDILCFNQTGAGLGHVQLSVPLVPVPSL